jgi:hypothetical protein
MSLKLFCLKLMSLKNPKISKKKSKNARAKK